MMMNKPLPGTLHELLTIAMEDLEKVEMEIRGGNKNLEIDMGNWHAVLENLDDVDIVVHAAAFNQVPSCEYNPFEAVATNIIGSQNVIDAALDHNVEKVIGVSTDKAVNPVNLYGATKMCMEKIIYLYLVPGRRNYKQIMMRLKNYLKQRPMQKTFKIKINNFQYNIPL